MYELSADDIKLIHRRVQERFGISPAIKDQGIIQGIADRPNTNLYGGYVPYDDIYLKAASILEGLVRMHPFIDGNKRTGLLSMLAYMHLNGYYVILPVDAVRFTVELAKNENNDPESMKVIIKEVADWIQKISARNSFSAFCKAFRYSVLPMFGLAILIIFRRKDAASNRVINWFAYDLEPQKVDEFGDTWKFFIDVISGKYSGILSKTSTTNT